MSAFADVAGIDPHELWQGVLGRVVQGELMTLAVVELEPGGAVPEHSHESEQLGVLVSGSVTFRIGEETRELRPGAMWAIGANVPHDVLVGPDGAVVVEAFSPRRAEWDALERRPAAEPRWP